MRHKQKLFLIMLTGLSILFVGCTTPTPTVVVPSNFKAIANPMAENLISGLDKQDYAIFSRDFDEKLLKALPSTAMTELRKLLWKQYGNYQSLEIKNVLEEKGYIITLYNLIFEKGNLDMQLVFTSNAPYKISGLWFPPK